jgi:hypothetical protein
MDAYNQWLDGQWTAKLAEFRNRLTPFEVGI